MNLKKTIEDPMQAKVVPLQSNSQPDKNLLTQELPKCAPLYKKLDLLAAGL